MELYDIVLKLTGKIEPVGDHNIDEQRWQNFNEICKLALILVEDIKDVSRFKDRHEFSVSSIGEKAYNTLLEINEIINN